LSHATRTDSTPVAEPVKLRGMPRKLPREVKARVVALIAQDKDSPEIIATIAREFPGESVSRNTISALRGKIGLVGKAGRRHSKDYKSPHAPLLAELALYEDPPLSLRDKAAITGLSPEGVRQILSDGK